MVFVHKISQPKLSNQHYSLKIHWTQSPQTVIFFCHHVFRSAINLTQNIPTLTSSEFLCHKAGAKEWQKTMNFKTVVGMSLQNWELRFAYYITKRTILQFTTCIPNPYTVCHQEKERFNSLALVPWVSKYPSQTLSPVLLHPSAHQ